jgi:hypothetical protein
MITWTKAGWIGIRSAIIGTFLFLMVDAVEFFIEDAANAKSWDLISMMIWGLAFFLIGSLLSAIFGFLGGKLILWLIRKKNIKSQFSVILGTGIGVFSVVVISLPYLFLVLGAHNYWSIEHNPVFMIYLHRLVIAVIIAGLMGGWTAQIITKSIKNSVSDTISVVGVE